MKKFLKVLLTIIAIPVVLGLLYLLLLGFLTIVEYRPEPVEDVAIDNPSGTLIREGESVRIMTWNLGFGCLGDNADFFLDGGKGVKTADAERIEYNMSGIMNEIKDIDPDIVFVQEIDKHSKRSEYRDETEDLRNTLPEFCNSYAMNYKALYVPYPIPTIGQVDAGVMTLSGFNTESAERISLPSPYGWPLRLGNLKRCLLVSRLPVEGSDKQLVLVNLHLEAYDNGEGKIAQTAQLKKLLEDEVAKGNYVIAGGDFNQTFSNIDVSAYPTYEGNWQAGEIEAESFSENFAICMDNSAPGCRSLVKPYADADKENFQYYVIDGFLVSKNIEVEKYNTVDCDFKWTDHNPLVMEFVLK